MTNVIAILSGKGGVGKSLTAINLAAALNHFNKDTLIVDANFTTPNIGIYLGNPTHKINIHKILQNKYHISQAIQHHDSGIKFISGSLSLKDLEKANIDKFSEAINDLHGMLDYVLIDAAAGLGNEALTSIEAADEILVVTNPTLAAVTDALKTIQVANLFNKPIKGVILTRAKHDELDMSIPNIELLTEYPVLGVIPEDDTIRKSITKRFPIVNLYPNAPASKAYKNLAASMLGLDYHEQIAKKGFLDSLLDLFRFK